ncbi:hypothetical protein [Streptomyces asiaticus]|uniref:hypothetical protein n=1 Tax=Streptomyces asiaticus TaxID=114695 RepID=UPI001BA72A92|nr:hypothetical protein [Streptomyces asiaticus]
MKVEITGEQLTAAIREVVAENPDRVYEAPQHMRDGYSCYYVHTDEDGNNTQAGCVVGQALCRLGVPLSRLAGLEGSTADYVVPETTTLSDRDPAVAFANRVQEKQDLGATWADALRTA